VPEVKGLVCSKLGVVRLCHARGVRWFGHKTSPTRRLDEIWMTLQASLTALAGWSNIVGRSASRSFEAVDMLRDRKACIEAKQACGGCEPVQWRIDKVTQVAPRGCVSSFQGLGVV
jgi:hypothetical protein